MVSLVLVFMLLVLLLRPSLLPPNHCLLRRPPLLPPNHCLLLLPPPPWNRLLLPLPFRFLLVQALGDGSGPAAAVLLGSERPKMRACFFLSIRRRYGSVGNLEPD